MKCVYCSHFDSKVVDSRQTDDGARIRRRRECTSCSKRFTTYEVVEYIPLTIIKKDSTRQPFSAEKLINSLTRACAKSSISMDNLDKLKNLVIEVEDHFANKMEKEINSSELGELILTKLRDIDQVAYIRFASVYRDFKDIDSFLDELNDLKNLKDTPHINGTSEN